MIREFLLLLLFFCELIETCLHTTSRCLCPLVKFTFSLQGKRREAEDEHICYLFKNLSARLLCDFGASFCECLLLLCCAVRFILFFKWILPLLLFRFRVQQHGGTQAAGGQGGVATEDMPYLSVDQRHCHNKRDYLANKHSNALRRHRRHTQESARLRHKSSQFMFSSSNLIYAVCMCVYVCVCNITVCFTPNALHNSNTAE